MAIQQLFALIKSDLLRLSGYEYPDTAPNIWKNVFNPRFFPVLLFRLARYCYESKLLKLLSPLFSWLNVILFGVEITSRCEVGPGLMIPHSVGTVIGATKIGNNATIFQGVTLGATKLDLAFDATLRPQLGDHVTIGAGAKVLGGIMIGDRVTIGANAVVLTTLEANTVAVGIPAKPL
jgi:serine O-acetyltransferase